MYQIDYKIAIESLLVPDKRTKKTVSFNKALVSEVSNNHELLFNTYKEYSAVPVWASGHYDRNELVKYGKSIFQSIEDGNTTEPTYSEKWRIVSDNFLGSDFRLKIRGEKLNLEYALNIWFDSVFKQPPLVSDIFLTTNPVTPITVFRVGDESFNSSAVYLDKSVEFVINSYSFDEQYNLVVNVPIAKFNSLGDSDSIRTSVIKNFIEKYINAGLTYKIITY
jgi:hypothetical protein